MYIFENQRYEQDDITEIVPFGGKVMVTFADGWTYFSDMRDIPFRDA